MQNKNSRLTFLSGILGIVCACTGIVLTILTFSGRTGEPYSIFNHFISELGNRKFSQSGYLFNTGLFFTGVCMLPFNIGISKLLQSNIRSVLIPVGVISAVCCSMVGVFDSSNFKVHVVFAMAFFNFALLGTFLFSIAVWKEGEDSFFPRYFSFLSILPIVCLVAFLIERWHFAPQFAEAHIRSMFYHRPDFWLLPFLEWTVFFSLLIWIAIICIHLWQARKQ